MTATKEALGNALALSVEVETPIVLNVMTCCRGCTTERDVQKAYDKQAKEFNLPAVTFEEDAPNAVWHFGGQGNHLFFSANGSPQSQEGDECDCQWADEEWEEDDEGNETLINESEFEECSLCRNGPTYLPWTDSLALNHSTNDAARSAVASLKKAGLQANWDGDDLTVIEVDF